MRLIMVTAPEGRGADVQKIAFSVGISKVSRRSVESHHSDGKVESKDVVDIETSTSIGKRFIDALLAADFFDQDAFTVSVRSPVSIISKTRLREITVPLPGSATDLRKNFFNSPISLTALSVAYLLPRLSWLTE